MNAVDIVQEPLRNALGEALPLFTAAVVGLGVVGLVVVTTLFGFVEDAVS